MPFNCHLGARNTMPDNLSIHNMPESDRPRERLIAEGAGVLSNAELLAILLRTGTAEENALHLAERILARHDGLHGLARISVSELIQLKGVGAAKAAQIAAALEIAKRLVAFSPNHRPIIRRAEDAATFLADMRSLPQEQVRLMLLDSSQHLITIQTIYVGTLNASVIRIAELFREPIIRNSPAVILVHNHPSGDPAPSPEDIELTRSIISAGALLDIAVLDHVIIGHDTWSSMKELGLVFS